MVTKLSTALIDDREFWNRVICHGYQTSMRLRRTEFGFGTG